MTDNENEVEALIRGLASKTANIHSFFTDIIKAKSTKKTGNLEKEELGTPRLTQRGVLELELFCRNIYKQDLWADYFKDIAEIQTATSLSKDGTLIKLAVTNKTELAETTKEKKKNKGMFGFGRKP